MDWYSRLSLGKTLLFPFFFCKICYRIEFAWIMRDTLNYTLTTISDDKNTQRVCASSVKDSRDAWLRQLSLTWFHWKPNHWMGNPSIPEKSPGRSHPLVQSNWIPLLIHSYTSLMKSTWLGAQKANKLKKPLIFVFLS